ncbi:MAG: response regulator [Patescibacteria group bacterium]
MSKIMLAEDDNNLREIYEARLQAEGYNIVSAKDGEEALVVAKAEKPDLIISDVMMPKISGFEMLDILRNTDGLKDVKVIMLTALGQSDDQKRADLLGADRYLVKSQVTLEDIVKVTHELLQDSGADTAPAAEAPTPETTPESAPEATQEAPAVVEAPAVETPPVEPAPEVVPEPAPTPEPAPAPAPEPVETPVAVAPEPAPEPSEAAVQSTTQEETAVETQIEDFVAGAGSDAPAPVADDTSDAATSTDTDAADDDKLVDEAVEAFAANTSGEAPAEPAPAPEAEPETAEAPEETSNEETDGSSVEIARKKIISPPDNGPKKDLDALLAIETAKEEAAAPTAVVATDADGSQTTTPSSPAGPTAQPAATPSSTIAPTPAPAPAPSDPNDPSNIAL